MKTELKATPEVESIVASSLPEGMALVWNPQGNQRGIHCVELTLCNGTQTRKLAIAVRATVAHSTLPFEPTILAVDRGETHLIVIGAYDVKAAQTEIAVLNSVTGETQQRRSVNHEVLNCLVNEDSIFISCRSGNDGDSIVRCLKTDGLEESATSSAIPGLRQLALSKNSLFAVSESAVLELSPGDLKLKKRVSVEPGIAVRVDDQGIWMGELLCDESLVPRLHSGPLDQNGETRFAGRTRGAMLPSGSFGERLSSTGNPANCSLVDTNSRCMLSANVEFVAGFGVVKVRSFSLKEPFVNLGNFRSQDRVGENSVITGEFAMSLDADADTARGNQQGLPICCGEKSIFVAFENRLMRSNLSDLRDPREEELASWPSFEMRQSSFAIDGVGTTQFTHKLTQPQDAIYQLASATPGLSIDAANGTVTVNEAETTDYAIQKLKRTLVSMSKGSEPVSGTFQKLLQNSPGLLVAPPNVESSDQQRIFLPVAIAVQARIAGNRTTTMRYGILASIPLDMIRTQLNELELQMLTTSSPSNPAKPSTVAPSGASPNGTPATQAEDKSAQQRIDALEKRIEDMESSLKTINTQRDTLIEVLKKKDSTGGNR